jgi:DNA-directed RNA polymerase specialized sigma24 family protein
MGTELNLLCLDLAGLRDDERRFLLLSADHGLGVEDLAEVFEMPTDAARRVLESARRKYDRCYRRFRW